ncbi:unnamed protein product [Cercospora beticola]|nr:unnamed protein product [Cercospora beticola]
MAMVATGEIMIASTYVCATSAYMKKCKLVGTRQVALKSLLILFAVRCNHIHESVIGEVERAETQETVMVNAMEIGLYTSKYGGGPPPQTGFHLGACRNGTKVFCCQSAHWNDLTSQCHWARGAMQCESGFEQAAVKFDQRHQHWEYYCCPAPNKFHGCRWAGDRNQNCDNNHCQEYEIQLMTDNTGDDTLPCPHHRKRALCCPFPPESAFVPVPLAEIFEHPPAAQDIVSWEIGYPSSSPSKHSPQGVAFAWLLIDGPQDVVTNLKRKRDGTPSDLIFLGCSHAVGRDQQVIRFVCSSAPTDSGSDCDHMMEGGVEGTVVELPTECTMAKYAIAHAVTLSGDQTLPGHLSSIANTTVFELTFSFDFGLVKRGSGPVSFRVDFDTRGGCWELVVDENSDKTVTPIPHSKRWVGTNQAAWNKKFDQWLGMDIGEEKQNGIALEQDFNRKLVSNVAACENGASEYADINLKGVLKAHIRAAGTIIGEIGPNPRIDHASVILETDIDVEISSETVLSGGFNTPRLAGEIVRLEKVNEGFNHPGVISIFPALRAEAGIQGSLNFTGNLTVNAKGRTKESQGLRNAWPHALRETSGDTEGIELTATETFSGTVREVQSAVDYSIDLDAEAGVRINLNPFGWKGRGYDMFLGSAFSTISQVSSKAEEYNNMFYYSQSTSPGRRILKYDKSNNVGDFEPWANDDNGSPTKSKGSPPKQLAVGRVGNNFGDSPRPNIRPEVENPLLDPGHLLGMVCSATEEKKPCPFHDFGCQYSICAEPGADCPLEEGSDDGWDEGRDELRREEHHSLANALELSYQDPRNLSSADWVEYIVDDRGTRREYRCDFSLNRHLIIKESGYPSAGVIFNGRAGSTVRKSVFEYASNSDCSDPDIREVQVSAGTGYVTEHILELQTIKEFLEALERGTMTSRKQFKNRYSVDARYFMNYWNQPTLDKTTPPIPRMNRQGSLIPNVRVFEALGTNRNRQQFVLTTPEINGVKAKLWQRRAPRLAREYDNDVEEWLRCHKGPDTFLKYLRATRAVFVYLQEKSEVRNRYLALKRAVRTELEIISKHDISVYNLAGLPAAWDEFMDDLIMVICTTASQWMLDRIADTKDYINAHQSSNLPGNVKQVQIALETMRILAKGIGNKI